MSKFIYKIIAFSSLLICFSFNMFAQIPKRPVQSASEAKSTTPVAVQPEGDSTLYYLVLLLLVVGLVSAVGWWYKSRGDKRLSGAESSNKLDDGSVDADKEMEWLRKHSKTINRQQPKKKRKLKNSANGNKVLSNKKVESLKGNINDASFAETRAKLDKIKFSKLPINSFEKVNTAKRYNSLQLSNDDALMSAIEQTHDEFEEDESIRELAVRILARFKARNSVEALSQVALYDLSASLRSKALTALAEFDHESVFEIILLGCADPTREVRAAAARALFQLSFNRADAWARIAQSDDEYRIVQSAKAAVESGLVERSIERLIHEDYKYAYEAFTLIALLIKANETEEIFKILEYHPNISVQLAILRVLEIVKDPIVLPQVYSFIERNTLPEDLSNAANEVIRNCDLVPA